MNHQWIDGPDGSKYHCKRCGISKCDDHVCWDTCESWRERKIQEKIFSVVPVYGETVCLEICELVSRGVATPSEIDWFSILHVKSCWLEGPSNPVVRNLYRGRIRSLVKSAGRYYTRLFCNRDLYVPLFSGR